MNLYVKCISMYIVHKLYVIYLINIRFKLAKSHNLELDFVFVFYVYTLHLSFNIRFYQNFKFVHGTAIKFM